MIYEYIQYLFLYLKLVVHGIELQSVVLNFCTQSTTEYKYIYSVTVILVNLYLYAGEPVSRSTRQFSASETLQFDPKRGEESGAVGQLEVCFVLFVT